MSVASGFVNPYPSTPRRSNLQGYMTRPTLRNYACPFRPKRL